MRVLERSGMKRVSSAFSSSSSQLSSSGSDADFSMNYAPKARVQNLRDFSSELKAMGVYMADYTNWRKGSAKGARGEALDVLQQVNNAYLKDAALHEADEPEDIFCFRKEYKAWRSGRPRGNRVSIERVPPCIATAGGA